LLEEIETMPDSPSRIAECPLQFEARVVTIQKGDCAAGPNPLSTFMTIGTQVLHVHAHRDIVVPAPVLTGDTAQLYPRYQPLRHVTGTTARHGDRRRPAPVPGRATGG